ncbi:hypothetical protein NDU88_010441 [Pleurodeles waltl]|uniref:Uncharacterized protein n=1 Tax=Pleurodeles waltl TaxID=8319 RepID=A0AAV7RZ16_PLEWA|nr:hypothetical protein NDU88_010441 [Pleurodeles waltl]
MRERVPVFKSHRDAIKCIKPGSDSWCRTGQTSMRCGLITGKTKSNEKRRRTARDREEVAPGGTRTLCDSIEAGAGGVTGSVVLYSAFCFSRRVG